MRNKPRSAMALVLLVAGFSTVLVTNASAGGLDGCPTAPPQATLSVGQLPDSTTGYPSTELLCPFRIVDVRAPHTGTSKFEIDTKYAGPATGPTIGFGSEAPDQLPLSLPDCNLYHESVRLYKKQWLTLSAPAEFTMIGSASFSAHMAPADNDPDFPSPQHCVRDVISSSLPPDLNTGSWPLGATYRVAVRIVTTAPQKVRVHTSSWVPVIPN
jgi:hypothetical protein